MRNWKGMIILVNINAPYESQGMEGRMKSEANEDIIDENGPIGILQN